MKTTENKNRETLTYMQNWDMQSQQLQDSFPTLYNRNLKCRYSNENVSVKPEIRLNLNRA
jgi:hypothetical protein